MHFVLWGTSQRVPTYRTDGVGLGFNALRALGYFSTQSMVKVQYKRTLFQCTSCFGVLLNTLWQTLTLSGLRVSMHFVLWGTSQLGKGMVLPTLPSCFNALRALGYFSTQPSNRRRRHSNVSMHFVLWGTSQPTNPRRTARDVFVSMHFVLWGTSQPSLALPPIRQFLVSMHFVLWGTSQLQGL